MIIVRELGVKLLVVGDGRDLLVARDGGGLSHHDNRAPIETRHIFVDRHINLRSGIHLSDLGGLKFRFRGRKVLVFERATNRTHRHLRNR